MEKIMYLLWKQPGQDMQAFSARLRGPVAAGLREAGVRHVRVNLSDADVAPADKLRMTNSGPAFDAVLSLWVDTAVWRARYEALFADAVSRMHAYLVCESAPIPHDAHMPTDGTRVEGMCQVVMLTRPPRIAPEVWFEIWQGSHTGIAIDTQSTFGYRQNVILRALSYAAPTYTAIIEENFPAAAMTSPHAFYAADGDDAKLEANLKAMMDSCARFIDTDKIDVVPTSEYNFAGS